MVTTLSIVELHSNNMMVGTIIDIRGKDCEVTLRKGVGGFTLSYAMSFSVIVAFEGKLSSKFHVLS